MYRFVLLGALFLGALFAQPSGIVQPFTATDITCTGSNQQIQTTGTARSITLKTPTANAAVVRVGDTNISATRGITIEAGGSYTFMQLSAVQGGSVSESLYDLSKVYVRCTSADKVQVLWTK